MKLNAKHCHSRSSLSAQALLTILLLLVSGCDWNDNPEVFKRSAFIMGTIVRVAVVDSDPGGASLKIERAFEEMRRIEKLMGTSHESGDIARINREAGNAPVKVTRESLKIIRDSLAVTSLTKRKFDITMGALTRLWDFENNARDKIVPSKEDVAEKRSLVGIDGLGINPEAMTVRLKRKGMALDLGGVAKGYAVDMAVKLLKRDGATAGIVDAGGDLKLFGLKPNGKAWRIGIQHPRDPNELLAVLELTDKVVITSGDYERYFIKEGTRYHHILDPATGYPADKCRSVTIVTDNAAYADAVATGIFVLGPEQGMDIIRREKDLEGVIVSIEGDVLVSDGLKKKIDLL